MSKLGNWVEADIAINGTRLSFAQSMTVRVAVGAFAMYISGLPEKEKTGVFGEDGYMARLAEIEALLVAIQPPATEPKP